MYVVTMVRKGFDDRECSVRVTAKAVDEAVRFSTRVDEEARRTAAECLARDAAVRRWFGRTRLWGPDQAHPYRGQVWQPARDGGRDAVTGMITLRVRP